MLINRRKLWKKETFVILLQLISNKINFLCDQLYTFSSIFSNVLHIACDVF